MRKILLSFFMLFAIMSTVFAQKLKVESFKLASNDITAQSHPRKDLNNLNCALVKVGIALDGVKFDGSIMGDPIQKLGEYWVYMPKGVSMLQVLHKNYTPLMVNFYDYDVGKVESGMTYILTLSKPSGSTEPTDAGGNFYALTVNPKNAVVTIDGNQQTVSTDGEYSAMLPYGNHTYKVEAGGYISKSGSFTISSSDMTPINVSLVSAMATVSVTCPTPAVSLYVDKKSVGTMPWTGSLKEGMHLIEAKKDGYRSQQRTINLSQQQKLDVAFNELAAIQGNLSVNYKPFGAEVYIDGNKVGQSPHVFNGIMVGSHKVEIKKDGYGTDSKTVSILEGQTASLSGVLTTNTSSSVASGASSSGNTITIPVKDGISIDMVRVEAGTFTMGATAEMKEPYDDEKPTHRVTLTNDYYIGKYEVTQALWQAVMGNNPSSFKGDNLPVEQVSWNDCQKFISQLNRITGKTFRLPTEAEWEYAARGGNKSRGYQYSGSNNLSDVAWYTDNSGYKTHTVGTKQPNELGIYDMSGNVLEWCQDWYGIYSSSSQINPTGATSGSDRVNRGGSWLYDARDSRSSYRYEIMPNCRIGSLGVRLVFSE
ncbi:SUMF1/EgtB/PvdO family nonheme iron enzyme [uncultured Prevotella sp.]|uniref:SUMF1/EgtB/PvdO family nonheme iron enzyme n=1 Tax=uncultured Prevotella sp. TaxID=159272 RepID=UPI00266DB377|nr:SUMF1/EgtB/PvdO family nonheme iron enzyme [uncultured Prevotella sp.]